MDAPEEQFPAASSIRQIAYSLTGGPRPNAADASFGTPFPSRTSAPTEDRSNSTLTGLKVISVGFGCTAVRA
jgi:hypothetical protein